MMKVVGHSNRSLIVELDGKRAYISLKAYAYLMQHPDAKYEFQTLAVHHSEFSGKTFPETLWVAVYMPIRV